MVKIRGSQVTLELLSSQDYKEVSDKIHPAFIASWESLTLLW